MDHQPEMHDGAVTLIRHVEEHGGTDDALVILEIILACTHPDFVMSPASAAFLPANLREAVADFVRIVLLEGLSEAQRGSLFSWAQRKMMAGPGAPRA